MPKVKKRQEACKSSCEEGAPELRKERSIYKRERERIRGAKGRDGREKVRAFD